jgi:hypothetical protein
MAGHPSRKELEKGLRMSRRSFPFKLGIGSVFAGGLWAAHYFLRLPTWITWFGTYAGLFDAISDWINIFYCRRALRRMDADRP